MILYYIIGHSRAAAGGGPASAAARRRPAWPPLSNDRGQTERRSFRLSRRFRGQCLSVPDKLSTAKRVSTGT